jgi:CheY-like chemotaxis protein
MPISSEKQTPLVAIVDDDVWIGQSLTRILKVLGFRVRFYESGSDFLLSLGTKNPDCILIDEQMPKFTGLQILQCLIDKSIVIPSLLITGDADESLWSKARSLGADGILLKPFSIDDLCTSINQVLGCPGFVPTRCPWPCPAINQGVWNCGFAGFPEPSIEYLNTHPGPHRPATLTALAHYGEPLARYGKPLALALREANVFKFQASHSASEIESAN